ncbi:MAG: TatD family hydrolase [Sphingobacteriales bacterium]|nr:TatD family hydrolase [Sphingobacteriales bacterium]
MFINIHTHQPPATGEWALQNLGENPAEIRVPGCYSAGIHPWQISPFHWEKQMDTLRRVSRLPGVLAIGECGLDKACATPFPLQETVFAAQVQWAHTIGKPLVIHCVRAWEELLSALQQLPDRVPVIFHGFNKNETLAKRITGKGYYISLGKALQKPAMQQVLAAVAPDHFFLETDDEELSIQTVYDWAANALSIDHNSLVLQIQKNAVAVFGAAVQL